MGSKVKACPACGNDVAKSAKTCPHCGKKLKMGLFVKLLIGIGALAVLGVALSPSEEEKEQNLMSTLSETENATPSDVHPFALAQAFNLGSSYTDVQRDNLESELKGKIVQWSLPVYEVTKRSDNKYRIQSKVSANAVGAFINLYSRNDEESAYIEGLKTDSLLSFKGEINGTSVRYINIQNAVLAIR